MADYGLKVSKDRLNVFTEQKPLNFQYNTKFESFKIKEEVVKSIPSNGTATVVHGFKYVPIFLAFGESNINANHKVLCTASRTVADLSAQSTTYQVSIRDWDGAGDRAVYANILEDPVSVY